MSPGEFAEIVLVRMEWAVLAYFAVVNTLYLVLLVSSGIDMRAHLRTIRHESRWRILQSEIAPRISLLAPAYNEQETVVESVRAMLGLQYPNLEVVVVNDGSTDETMDRLRAEFDLVPILPVYRRVVDHKPIINLFRSRSRPSLVVVDKENGGKADALNAGVNVATGDLVCAVDADTLIEPDALQRMVRPFLTDDDVVAVGGTIRVVNGSMVRDGRVVECRVSRHPLAAVQILEYLRAFLFGRLGWNRLGGNLIISGAFGLFDRDAILRAGGYAHDTVGEDMELVLRLRRDGLRSGRASRVAFVADPVAWTEVPTTLRVLGRQRDRWHRGLADSLWRNRGVFLNPRYGALGLVVYPTFVFVELLAPLVEAAGLLGLGVGLAVDAVNVRFAIVFFLVAYGYGMFLNVFALLLEEVSFHRYERTWDRLVLLLAAVGETLGYRQLTIVWRLRGLAKSVRKRQDWGVMHRRGFRTATPAEPSALAEGPVVVGGLVPSDPLLGHGRTGESAGSEAVPRSTGSSPTRGRGAGFGDGRG